MKKIEIKLKECCLTCEHFDPSGCIGLVPSVLCCGEPDRVIACGHMAVCAKYNGIIEPVRCKDCAFRGTDECAMNYTCSNCGGQWSWESENGFCNYGEARKKT